MFHRRLLLLAAGVAVVMAVLGLQMFRLAVVEGSEHLREAESLLRSRKLVPTVRGRIVDRKGRVLAEDRPCWDLAVDYEVISGDWAFQQGLRAARQAHREHWNELSREQREVLINAESLAYQRRTEALWRALVAHGDMDREELEQRKRTVVRRVQIIRASVWERRAAAAGTVPLNEVVIPVREQRQTHTLVPAVDESVMSYFRKHEDRSGRGQIADDTFPGLHVLRSRTRVYPLAEVVVKTDRSSFPPPLRADELKAAEVPNVYGSLIGNLRQVAAENVDEAQGGHPYRRSDGSVDLKGYLPGDRVGRFGIERAAEWRLRGVRGQEILRRDTGETHRRPPRPGQDVQLTIDVFLQARMQALMDPAMGLMRVQDWHGSRHLPALPHGASMPLNGAAVVLEVDSGQILAMGYSPSDAAEDAEGEPPPIWPAESDLPGLNRALQAVYPPGSTLKPIVYCIAAGQGVISPDRRFECKGHLLENRPDKYRCWGWRPEQGKYHRHGVIGPVRGIAESCNIYFYNCGCELGPFRLIEGLQRWGFGRVPGLGLDPAEELPGLLPELGGVNPRGRGVTLENAILMGIGQGPVSATPLQVANAHAALARGGYWTNPVLMMHRQSEQDGLALQLPDRVVANAWQGMYESANTAGGTGYRIDYGGVVEKTLNLTGVTCRAKTGTAQTAVPRWIDLNRNGRREEEERFTGSHSWFVCHVSRAGEDRAAYVIAAVVEYGGSGGRVTGPLVNQILHAMRAEGYL